MAGWKYDPYDERWLNDFTDTSGMTCEVPLEEYERLKQIEKEYGRLKQIEKDYEVCMKMLEKTN